MSLSDEEKNKIKSALNAKISENKQNLICPICKCTNFILAEGYIRDDLQEKINAALLGGVGIPQIAVVCAHCGFVMKFSAGILGLMTPREVENDPSN